MKSRCRLHEEARKGPVAAEVLLCCGVQVTDTSALTHAPVMMTQNSLSRTMSSPGPPTLRSGGLWA